MLATQIRANQAIEIAAPVVIEHMEAGDEEKDSGDVVAEAVLAGEEIEEFACEERLAVLALVLAVLAGLAKDLLVGDGPGGAGDGKREQHKVGELAR